MEEIYRNEELIEFVGGGKLILDALIKRFEIYEQDYKVYIELYFLSKDLATKAERQFKVRFINVTEYEFYWNNTYRFYTVERYKFFKSDKGFYISLDPADESDEISDNDQDIIISKEIEGTFV